MRLHDIQPDLHRPSTEEDPATLCTTCQTENPDPESECPAEGM